MVVYLNTKRVFFWRSHERFVCLIIRSIFFFHVISRDGPQKRSDSNNNGIIACAVIVENSPARVHVLACAFHVDVPTG